MAKVYDFASKRRLDTKQDTTKNDAEAANGRYLGNIGVENAKRFKDVLSVVEGIMERFFEVQDELDEMAALHLTNMEYISRMLKADVDLDENELMVSEEGHVWVVPVEDDE
jgi:hypothetical protein